LEVTVDTTSIAPPPRGDTRELRALRLFEERGHEIVRTAPFVYNVPSCSGEDFYVVRYDKETCECEDYRRRGESCKHILAVGVKRAKRRAKRRGESL
jgi:predicted nucleic acid-binding Zn finger protein